MQFPELEQIVFGPGESKTAVLFGKGLPYRHATTEIQGTSEGTIFIVLRHDPVGERIEAESGGVRRSWFSRLFGWGD